MNNNKIEQAIQYLNKEVDNLCRQDRVVHRHNHITREEMLRCAVVNIATLLEVLEILKEEK